MNSTMPLQISQRSDENFHVGTRFPGRPKFENPETVSEIHQSAKHQEFMKRESQLEREQRGKVRQGKKILMRDTSGETVMIFRSKIQAIEYMQEVFGLGSRKSSMNIQIHSEMGREWRGFLWSYVPPETRHSTQPE